MDGDAEPSATIDLAGDFASGPTYRVGKAGVVYVFVGSGIDSFRTVMSSQAGPIFDNRQLLGGYRFVVTLYRPGEHDITDSAHAATCKVSVKYPSRDGWLRTKDADPVTVSIAQGQATPANLTVEPGQGIVVLTIDGSRIATTLQAERDMVDDREVLTEMRRS